MKLDKRRDKEVIMPCVSLTSDTNLHCQNTIAQNVHNNIHTYATSSFEGLGVEDVL